MENLTLTNRTMVENFDLTNLTNDQLELLTNRALATRQSKVEEKLSELANNQKKIEESTKITEEKLNITVDELEKTKKFIDVLGFAVNSYKFQILKKKAVSRVYSLFNNDVTSVEFMLWSSYFFKKIYSDIAHNFNVNKCANINVEDFQAACYIAEYWTPSTSYINEKIEEMKNRAKMGTLKQERVMALNAYLRVTNNGEINPFSN